MDGWTVHRNSGGAAVVISFTCCCLCCALDVPVHACLFFSSSPRVRALSLSSDIRSGLVVNLNLNVVKGDILIRFHAESDPFPSLATSTHQVCQPLLFPSCCVKLSTQTLT